MAAASDSNYVKKETMLVIALVALVAGFLGGIVFSAMRSTSGIPQTGSFQAPPSMPAQQQAPGFSPQLAEKIVSLEREVAVNRDNVEAWTELGHAYFDSDQFAKAITAYNKSLELRPNDANVWTDLGVMYRRDGQPDKALEAFDKAIGLDPRHEQSRFNKGIVLKYDFDDREGAIKAWEELMKVNPQAVAPNGKPISEAIKDL